MGWDFSVFARNRTNQPKYIPFKPLIWAYRKFSLDS